MDNLCHTLAGAALGKAGLASRTRYGMATLMVSANLPDIDVAVFLTDTLPMSFRRGWTHGVLAQLTLAHRARRGHVADWEVKTADGSRQTADHQAPADGSQLPAASSTGRRQPAAGDRSARRRTCRSVSSSCCRSSACTRTSSSTS